MDIIEANNHAFLIALVKKQAAQLEAVCDVLSNAAAFGKAVESSDILAAIRTEAGAK